jgi:hypothetical protein
MSISAPPIRFWKPISTAPRLPRSPGHGFGPLIGLFVPYNPARFSQEKCWDVGYWCEHHKCFRFTGDDGPNDMQPTHWCEIDFPAIAPEDYAGQGVLATGGQDGL